jgi:hypothetical protein
MRMHIGRKHKKNVCPPNTKGARVLAAKNGEHQSGAIIVAENGSNSPGPALGLDRRSRAWRMANPQEARPIGGKGVPRSAAPKKAHAKADVCVFCPRCGLNMAVAQTVYTVAVRHS